MCPGRSYNYSEYAGDDEKQQFVEEIEMMKKLGQHKNVVNITAWRTKMEPFLLVVEYVPKRDLLKYLQRIRTQVRLITPDDTTCQSFNQSISQPNKQSTN